MQPIRIAWVMPITCIYWQVILQDFAKLFPETRIFTSRWIKDSTLFDNTLDIEVVGSLKVWQFKTQYASYGSKFAYVSPRIILKLLRYKPQLIFADTFSLWTLLVLLTKGLGKWRVILAYEGSASGVNYLNSPLRLWIRRLMAQRADASITNSQAGKSYLVDVLKTEENKVFVHPYFVPDAKFSRTAQTTNLTISEKITSATYQKPIFIFIGRLIPRKGIQSLLTACVTLKNWGYENYSLLIIGEGTQQGELTAFCQENSISQQIKWIGQVDYLEITNYLDLSDILILPSLEDTWGMVVLEAILAGKAVFCSTGAGASEIITQANNGCVFEPEDTVKLAQLMKNVIEHPDLITLMSKKSQEIASLYTPPVAVKFLATVIQFVFQNY